MPSTSFGRCGGVIVQLSKVQLRGRKMTSLDVVEREVLWREVLSRTARKSRLISYASDKIPSRDVRVRE